MTLYKISILQSISFIKRVCDYAKVSTFSIEIFANKKIILNIFLDAQINKSCFNEKDREIREDS